MIAYKLMRLRKDGSLGSLFINKKAVYPIGEWMASQSIPTKGFSVRDGWHCTFTKEAPHLSKKERVWAKVEVEDYTIYNRPKSQGGAWILSKRMKILNIDEPLSET